MKNETGNRIKELPTGERPYEKCLACGPEILSDAELLAVILRFGTSGSSAIELAQQVLRAGGNRDGLLGIHHLSVQELMEIHGIGEVKAIQIKAIGELSKRFSRNRKAQLPEFHHPEQIAEYYMEYLRHEEQEHLFCMMLDGRNRLIGEYGLFKGTVNASIISPREIFLEALRTRAVNIILVHNHPSGDPTPSRQDILITERILRTGELLDIHLIDHIIIGDQCYVSFQERDMLSMKE